MRLNLLELEATPNLISQEILQDSYSSANSRVSTGVLFIHSMIHILLLQYGTKFNAMIHQNKKRWALVHIVNVSITSIYSISHLECMQEIMMRLNWIDQSGEHVKHVGLYHPATKMSSGYIKWLNGGITWRGIHILLNVSETISRIYFLDFLISYHRQNTIPLC